MEKRSHNKNKNWLDDIIRIQNENRAYMNLSEGIIHDGEVRLINRSNHGSFTTER